jgi:hypothetical protein
MKHILPVLALLIGLGACNGRSTDDPGSTPVEEGSARGRIIDLSQHDVPLIVELDQTMPGADTPEVRWNEEFGKLEVDAGERFRITISEERGDIARLKAGLERDMLRDHTIIEEEDDLVIYRSEFPDETIVFVHFYRVIEHEGRSFVIESHDQGRFNETDIRRMARAVTPASRV